MPWTWMFFIKKHKPIPEYQSPNKWMDWMEKNNKVLDIQAELIETFSPEQREIYMRLKNASIEANIAKPKSSFLKRDIKI